MGNFTDTLSRHSLLQDRIQHSAEFVSEVRSALERLSAGRLSQVSIFAAGSLGRFESGRKSDLDVFFIADGEIQKDTQRCITKLQEIEIFADLIRLNETLSLPAFSGDGRYLRVHELRDLIGATGDSDRDDNENLFTTRLLLLMESQFLSNSTLYDEAIRQVLENYFRDGKGRKDFRPLFLLNDVLRYWRTLCLNYERQRTLQKPWWKNNLNLKFSRKLTVFSTVLGLVSSQMRNSEDFLVLSRKIPLERLAWVLDGIDDENLMEPYVKLLDDYESFLAAKSHAELEENTSAAVAKFTGKAQEFGAFFLRALQSPKLEKRLVDYVLI